MGLFIYLNRRYQQQQQMNNNNPGGYLNVADPRQYLGNSPVLAPHGAPANPKWQTRFSSGLKAGIKEDQFYSSPSTSSKPV